jgi:hypothetical protein
MVRRPLMTGGGRGTGDSGGFCLDILGAVLRLYSYLYQFVLSLFLFLVAGVVAIGGKHVLSLPMLPWEGASLTYWLLSLSLIGLVITALAVLGRLRFLFPVWSLFVVIMMARGFFLSPFYYGDGADEFWRVVALFFGGLIALAGSLTLVKRARR